MFLQRKSPVLWLAPCEPSVIRQNIFYMVIHYSKDDLSGQASFSLMQAETSLPLLSRNEVCGCFESAALELTGACSWGRYCLCRACGPSQMDRQTDRQTASSQAPLPRPLCSSFQPPSCSPQLFAELPPRRLFRSFCFWTALLCLCDLLWEHLRVLLANWIKLELYNSLQEI